ncbi:MULTISPECIES: hypothetical protein [unclassified Microcoleus]|uniref:hypothetical protein n=1 Tax=unclassified Microcoleus TaxID=2642155 RepID=UPI002FCF86B8
MTAHNISRKIATTFALIAITISCSSTKTVNQAQKKAEKPQPQIAYGDLIVDPESEYIMIPVILSGVEKESRRDPISSKLFSGKSSGSGTIGYNMIFYNKTNGKSNILLNRKALISKFEYLLGKKKPDNPSNQNGQTNQPKQNSSKKVSSKPQNQLLLFHIIDSDTNADGKLDDADAIVGYLSKLGGKSLQAITPPDTQLMSWVFDEKSGAIFITIRKDSDGDRKFTEKDDIDFVRVSVTKPNVGKEIIDGKNREELQKIMLNSK